MTLSLFGNIMTGIVGLLHVWFMIFEICFWTKPRTLKMFGMSAEQAEYSKVLAANQGAYNGVLAAGLFWALYMNEMNTKVFFLISVAVMGVFGAITANKRIIYIQTLPALIALTLIFLS